MSEKPPLGIMPKMIWQEKRLSDIKDVVYRYFKEDKKIPLEWLSEYNDLLVQLNPEVAVNIDFNPLFIKPKQWKDKVKIKFSAEKKELHPKAATSSAAGMDIKTVEAIAVHPGDFAKFKTGVKMTECPEDVFLMMELRSSLRFKHQLTQLGSGIIDSDYRGEIMGLLFNPTDEIVVIEAGERVAQLIPLKTAFNHVDPQHLSSDERQGGFGSTGKE